MGPDKTPDKEWPQIRHDLIKEIRGMREDIDKHGDVMQQVRSKLYGDLEANPPIVGIETRLAKLEEVEGGRVQSKNNLIKLAVGSFTVALGGAIIWVAQAIKSAFVVIKPGP